ncbi:hypothetical protein [Kitasatospora sp. NBC_00315]|uniref:hypothetical protein n=1 Tax=Kitasatospora sp. NBC_00315 TaxID=2975963 RepID=UPI00324945F6
MDCLSGRIEPAAVAIGAGTLAVLLLWRYLPPAIRVVPAPPVAVVLAGAVTALADLPVARVRVQGLWAAVQAPGLSAFAGVVSVTANSPRSPEPLEVEPPWPTAV